MTFRDAILFSVIILLAAAIGHAAEPVECAFGICLGKPYRGIEPDPSKVRPPVPNQAFEEYFITVVPSSKVVAEIRATSWKKASLEACHYDLKEIRELLIAKYGKDVLALESSAHPNRNIFLGCTFENRILIVYADDTLRNRAREEQRRKGL